MDASIRRHVLETGVPIFDVEYRLAPEHPYPTPHDDSWASLVWVRDYAAELNIDADRIALMGESAGGYLATCLAVHAQQQTKGLLISRLILVSPMLDDQAGQGPQAESRQYSWTPGDNTTAWNAILGPQPDRKPLKSEMAAVPARIANVAGLPRTLLQVAGGDLFLE